MSGKRSSHSNRKTFQSFNRIRKKKRFFAWSFIILFTGSLVLPLRSLALTGGPSAPEVNAPSKVTSSRMVDPFTGNLDYNIPILEVGDYPLSLTYNADISMDQQASWVGLGWSLNPGTINRGVRGLPDDFKEKDKVKKDFNVKPNTKAGLNAGINLELFGIDAIGTSGSLGASLGLFYDSYQGLGLNYSLSPSITVGSASKGALTASMGMNGGSHKTGISLDPSLSFPQRILGMERVTIGASLNSLSGLKSINVNAGMKNGLGNYNASFNSFTDQSYNPKIQFPMISTHGAFSFAGGVEVFGTFGSASLTGYYSNQHLKTKHKEIPAYGYMYTEAANNGPNALLDYKREKEGMYTSHKPNLPIPNYTHDVFNISGSGISGSFRAYRGDIGILYDHRVKSLGGDKAVPAVGGFNLSGEVGAGNMVKIGIDLKTNNSENSSGIWNHNNQILNPLSPVAAGQVNEKDYEPFHFRMSGEKRVMNNPLYHSAIMKRKPAAVKLAGGNIGKAHNTLHSDEGSRSVDKNSPVYKKNRVKRMQSIAYLTAAEADRMAISRKIKNYPLNSTPLDPSNVSSIDRLDGKRKKHHLSQITVNKKGKRYVYGIPAYNNKKKEVTFNIDKEKGSCDNGLIFYEEGKDNSKNNEAGLNHYFSATTTPAYAYSYLLSSVVSENYVDLRGDGPTPDDLGDYTRFNYSRVHKNYQWRTPYRKDMANFQENQYSLDKDNMANYVYGTKEIWYLNSIETRNYVARFIVSDRKDALGTKNENGGKNTGQKLKKLSRIELYTRADLEKHGKNAEPLKTVHFEYDYSLCPGVPNKVQSGKGKLTLQKVYMTYGDSEKGRFSPYDFTYHSGKHNPSYKLKANDRFGFYKENSCNTNQMNNSEFPYVAQDSSQTNEYIKAWKLNTIELPSGGTIRIDYEPDDYAYVQDKRAMQMFRIQGFAGQQNPASLNNQNQLYRKDPYGVNNYLFVKLKHPVQSRQELEAYLPDEDHLYFKAKLDVIGDGNNDPSDHYEYISGFAEYEEYGLYENSRQGSSYTHAWIKLKKVNIGDYKLKRKFKQKKAHPIAKRSWIYSKNNIPKHAFDRSDVQENFGRQLQNALNSLGDMMKMVKSLNSQLIERNFARRVKINKAMIRLNTPNGRKLGGGHRVGRITLTDQWSKMAPSGQNSTYGKVYRYTRQRNGQSISSGVIAYEPRVGREENPFFQPVFYQHNGDQLYMTKPFGASFFPGPTVGYSRVEIRDLPHPNANPAPAGYKVREFYTAKDFPVITEKTNLEDQHERPNPFASFNPFKFRFNETRAVSQGYKVVLNDMHGKPKARYTYRHGSEAPVSGVKYTYKTDERGRLENTVRVVHKDKSIEEATLGVNVDFVLDTRQQKSTTEMQGISMNTDGFLASIIPVFIPVPLPNYKKETVLFRSIVATKVIRKKGIVDEVIHYKNGAQLTTQNLAYDAVTGKPLILKNQNKYGDFTYTTKIPAHHQYQGMEPAYQNINATFTKVQVTNGEVQHNPISRILARGDKLYWADSKDPSRYNKAWVLKSSDRRSVLIDMQGDLLGDGTYDFKVIRSGYNNKAANQIGTVTSMKNPVAENKIDLNRNIQVLAANAREYKEDWQTYTGFRVEHVPAQCNCSQVNMGKGSSFNAVMRTIQMNDDGQQVSNSIAADAIKDKANDTASFVTIHKRRIANRLFVTFKLNGTGKEHCQVVFKNPGTDYFPKDGSFSNFRYVKKDPNRCDTLYHFKTDYTYQYQDTVTQNMMTHMERQVVTKSKTITVQGNSECFPVAVCDEQPLKSYFTCNLKPGDVVNPFVNNIRGIWRSYRNYNYKADRASGRAHESGYYTQFTPFTWKGQPSDAWVWQKQTTLIGPYGSQLEQKDPLGNYRANLYGYSYSRVKGVVKNGKHNQSGFDGFEDYGYYDLVSTFGECKPQKHVQFYLPQGTQVLSISSPVGNASYVTDEQSHSGQFSAKVTNAAPVQMKRKVSPYSGGASQGSSKEYILQEDDYVGIFTPKPGRYHISAWVRDKMAYANYNTTTYDFPKIVVEADGSNLTTIKPAGPLVDGWQQMNGSFRVPANATEVTIKLATDFGIAYFDDFRIHPYEAQMRSFVYNPYTLRHTATLDHNNYGIFYQYNEEGEFVGAKKETGKGIISVQESRKGSYKSDK